MIFYIIWTVYENFDMLEMVEPFVGLHVFTEPGRFWGGKSPPDRVYAEGNADPKYGNRKYNKITFNSSDPFYCKGPFLKDWVYDSRWRCRNVSCVVMDKPDITREGTLHLHTNSYPAAGASGPGNADFSASFDALPGEHCVDLRCLVDHS